MSPTARERALRFVADETEFQLGALPTEQPHPLTTNLSQTIAEDLVAGVRLILSVDEDIPPAANRALASEPFARLRAALVRALRDGRRIYFSGCGATGRLAILLEAAWRRHRRDPLGAHVVSVMTGGDRALIRSIEGFEDYQSFGRRQIAEAGVSAGDVVVAITEGGETSSVIGTAWEGLTRGAEVFFAFNNPAEVLRRTVARSRELLDHPEVTALDLSTGPMAVTGSTRMQAVTAELLVLGAALELAAVELAGGPTSSAEAYAERFAGVSAALRGDEATAAIAGMVAFEERAYRQGGLITYLADGYLLDILTDTTERAPTFSLPPFQPVDQTAAPPSWAFACHPLLDGSAAWRSLLGREPRGLAWDAEAYREMDAAPEIVAAPPPLGPTELERFDLGRGLLPVRTATPHSGLMVVQVAEEGGDERLWRAARALRTAHTELVGLAIGPDRPEANELVFHVPCDLPSSPLDVLRHLATKLVLNTISTATMARLGRVVGNGMVYVEATNKKLIDRATRLVMTLTGLGYTDACIALHETLDELRSLPPAERATRPPVVLTVERLRGGKPWRS